LKRIIQFDSHRRLRRFEKHAITRLTLKIPFPLDGAIVLACSLSELDPYPLAGLERCWAHEANSCYSAIVEFDSLTYAVGGGGHCCRERGTLFIRYLGSFIVWPLVIVCVETWERGVVRAWGFKFENARRGRDLQLRKHSPRERCFRWTCASRLSSYSVNV
jgi:hypothetical protein